MTLMARPVVLVADDEPLIRMDAVDTIQAAGFAAYEASSAQEVMSMLDAHPEINILFSDIKMPGAGDASEIVDLVAQMWPKVEIILTSGLTKAEANVTTGSRFLAKPYTAKQLVAPIQSVTLVQE